MILMQYTFRLSIVHFLIPLNPNIYAFHAIELENMKFMVLISFQINDFIDNL